MKIRIATLGCKLNFAESSALMNALVARGHVRAKQGEAADVVIVNTCTVTDAADHKDRQAIHRLRRENPGAELIMTGCYARLLHDRQQAGKALSPADEQILQQIDRLDPKDDVQFTPAFSREDRTRCFLKVQDGCNYFCTYCTIPFARGRSRNASIEEVVKMAQQALNEGAKELVLTGVNIADFGHSTNERFVDLLRALDSIEGDFRIRIGSCEPNLLSDKIIDLVANSKHIAPHFHIPLQSGSNEVLKIMHRRYTRELFAERVAHIRRVLPDAFIGVDCMVGVRGETDALFDDYTAFVASLPVSQLHVFTYSERRDTRMLEMDLYVVPKAERERRSKLMHEVSAAKTQAFYASQKGKQAMVLWESKRTKDEDGNDLMSGFTANYVRASRPYDKSKINTFEQIII